jgi:hypothetical protein
MQLPSWSRISILPVTVAFWSGNSTLASTSLVSIHLVNVSVLPASAPAMILMCWLLLRTALRWFGDNGFGWFSIFSRCWLFSIIILAWITYKADVDASFGSSLRAFRVTVVCHANGNAFQAVWSRGAFSGAVLGALTTLQRTLAAFRISRWIGHLTALQEKANFVLVDWERLILGSSESICFGKIRLLWLRWTKK